MIKKQNNLLTFVNIDKLLNEKINMGMYERYSIINIQHNFETDGWCLYLTLLNDEYVQNHTLQQSQKVCNDLGNLQHHFKYDPTVSKKNINEHNTYLEQIKQIKESNLPVVIIRITNPLLRDNQFYDFNVIVGDENKKFAEFEVKPKCIKDHLIFHDDEGKIILDYEKIRFPEGIKNLRYLLVSTMQEEQKKEYIAQYTAYCRKRVSNLLNLANLRIKEQINDIDKRSNKHYYEIVEKAKTIFDKNTEYIKTLDFRNEEFDIEDLL